jgi:hypothetical protein
MPETGTRSPPRPAPRIPAVPVYCLWTHAIRARRSLGAAGRGEHPIIPIARGRRVYIDRLPTAPARFIPVQGRSIERRRRDLPRRAIEIQARALLHFPFGSCRATPDNSDRSKAKYTSVPHLHFAVLSHRSMVSGTSSPRRGSRSRVQTTTRFRRRVISSLTIQSQLHWLVGGRVGRTAGIAKRVSTGNQPVQRVVCGSRTRAARAGPPLCAGLGAGIFRGPRRRSARGARACKST